MAEIKAVQTLGIPALEGKYAAQMDPWPIECQEFNRNYLFYDNLRTGRFTTTKCRECGYIGFPPTVICSRCWSCELEWVDLPKKAKVEAVTENLGAPPGFDVPLYIVWLSFGKDSPLKHLLARVINCNPGQVKEGDEVKLVTFDIPAHPMDVKKESKTCERVYYAFEPA